MALENFWKTPKEVLADLRQIQDSEKFIDIYLDETKSSCKVRGFLALQGGFLFSSYQENHLLALRRVQNHSLFMSFHQTSFDVATAAISEAFLLKEGTQTIVPIVPEIAMPEASILWVPSMTPTLRYQDDFRLDTDLVSNDSRRLVGSFHRVLSELIDAYSQEQNEYPMIEALRGQDPLAWLDESLKGIDFSGL